MVRLELLPVLFRRARRPGRRHASPQARRPAQDPGGTQISPSHKRRLGWILFLLAGVSVAAALILNAFQSNLLFFFTPTQAVAGEAMHGRPIRIGGLVADGSVVHGEGELSVSFDVTDTVNALPVTYRGVLPDLFREGQGVVVRGVLDEGGHFTASEVLAKHDENYMPPEAAAALEAAKTLDRP